MGFQKCPVCNGRGKVRLEGTINVICTSCKGKKVINEWTGVPPGSSSSGDFRDDDNRESQQEYFGK